jgi:hypothetical protein
MALRLDPSDATDRLVRRDIYDVRAGALTALFAEDEATRDGRIETFTGTTDAFSSMTEGTFAVGGGNSGNQDPEPVTPAAPAPTSVISIEGESATSTNSIIIATPEAIETERDNEADEPDAVQISASSALYAFPGEAEADTWLMANQERLAAGAASGEDTFVEVPDAPDFGDDSVTFKSDRAPGADERTGEGFRILARVGAIVADFDISSSADLPLNDVAKLMQLQVECIEAGGCTGLASLSGRLVEFEIVEPRSPATTEPTQVPRERPTRERSEEPAAPVVEPEPAPVEEPAPPPVEEPTLEPVEEPTVAPVEETPPAEEPVEEATPPVTEEPTPPPGEELSPTPAPEVEPTPVTEPTPSLVVEPTTIPEEEPTAVPDVVPTPAPVVEPTPEPGNDRENDRRNARDRIRDRKD